jgi:hypothetical protein
MASSCLNSARFASRFSAIASTMTSQFFSASIESAGLILATPLSGEHRECVAQIPARRFDRIATDVVEMHVDAGQRGDLRDATSHRAGSDDAERVCHEIFFHQIGFGFSSFVVQRITVQACPL